MDNPYNLPDRALEKTLANGVSLGIQQAQQRQQTLDGLTNLGLALWDLNDKRKVRKLQEWVYLVIGKSCLRNPKLQDLVDLDAWVERIASHGSPKFGVDEAATNLARQIDSEFTSLGYDVETYHAQADHYLQLKIEDQKFQEQNIERRRLYGKASTLPFSTVSQLASKISEVVQLKQIAQSDNKDNSDETESGSFKIFQDCSVCNKKVHTVTIYLLVTDWPLEHAKVLAQYNGWQESNLYGEGFSLMFTEDCHHKHLVPDARREIASLLDAESFATFRPVDWIEEVVELFSENGIELLELEGYDYSGLEDVGRWFKYGVASDETGDSQGVEYVVAVNLWCGLEGLNSESVEQLDALDFGFHSHGMWLSIELVNDYKPSRDELAKWTKIKESLLP